MYMQNKNIVTHMARAQSVLDRRRLNATPDHVLDELRKDAKRRVRRPRLLHSTHAHLFDRSVRRVTLCLVHSPPRKLLKEVRMLPVRELSTSK